MNYLKSTIRVILKYALAGVVISTITIIVCWKFGKEYHHILDYVAVAIFIIGALGMIGAVNTSFQDKQIKYTTGIDTSDQNTESTFSTLQSSIYRVLKLLITVATIFCISLI